MSVVFTITKQEIDEFIDDDNEVGGNDCDGYRVSLTTRSERCVEFDECFDTLDSAVAFITELKSDVPVASVDVPEDDTGKSVAAPQEVMEDKPEEAEGEVQESGPATGPESVDEDTDPTDPDHVANTEEGDDDDNDDDDDKSDGSDDSDDSKDNDRG